MENKLDKFFDAISTKITIQDENQKRMEAKFDQIPKNHSSSIHNIKVQLGQLANDVATQGQGNRPSNTETNPRDVKAITLRSGKELKLKDGMDKCVTIEKEAENKDSHDTEQKETMGKGVKINEEKVPKSSPPLAPKIPFPHRLRK